jgi:Family of unknown function (DUF6345)
MHRKLTPSGANRDIAVQEGRNMASFGIEGIRHFSHLRASGMFSEEEKKKIGDLTYVFNICNGLDEALQDEGHTRAFYWSETDCWEIDMRDDSQGGIDNEFVDAVDLFFINTHGGNWSAAAHLGYDVDHNAWISTSNHWRFGENFDLDWLMIYGCETVNFDNPPELWNVFQRLHEICGAWGSMYDGTTTDEVGEDVGDYLTDGDTVAMAWIDGVSDWHVDNHPIVLSMEREISFNDGNFLWILTNISRDHFHGHGTTTPDVPPADKFWMSWLWSEG